MKFLSCVLGALFLPASPARSAESARGKGTATPIKHLVVIFQENVSFDHYFATYPRAANKPGEPVFTPAKGTPTVNGLTAALLTANPNSAQPRRLDRAHAATCDQDHDYAPEERAFDNGLMDKFVEHTGEGEGQCDAKIVMDYFDGNTVTALWNYAQRFAMSDNSFGTTIGPSTPGAINLASGQTHGAVPADLSAEGEALTVGGTVIGDPDPEFDDCSASPTIRMMGISVGDLLNLRGVAWGFFEGGFLPTSRGKDDKAACASMHLGSDGKTKKDYIPHHQPFQYYKSTANPHHLPPSAVGLIGKGDQANHQYDLDHFWMAAAAHNLPEVSLLKAPAFQDGHAGYSDPITEQTFLVETVNRLQSLPEWKDMAIVISYDDSDGWYDHVMPPIVSRSNLQGADAPGACGAAPSGAYQGRCGYGPRLPLLVLSPFSRSNFVDHGLTDQTSILRFIEDNWGLGRIGDQSFDALAGSLLPLFDFESAPRLKPLILDPVSGTPKK